MMWGAGTHNGKQAEAVFPDAMRWLWRDWPNPIEAKEPGNPALKTILEPKEEWQAVAEGCSGAHLAANPDGDIFVADANAKKALPVTTKCPSLGPALAFGPNGEAYIATNDGILSSGKRIASGLRVLSLTVQNNGDIYATTGDEVWLIRSGGGKVRLDAGLNGASGIALSPDGFWLFVAQSHSRWGLSYRVRSDGTVDAREPFYDFSVPGDADDSGAGSVWTDRTGLAYVATRSGVQIFDRNGRVVAILPLPGNQAVTSLCFGGKDFSTLYVVSGGKIYKRKLHSAGAPAWNQAITLPRWGAG